MTTWLNVKNNAESTLALGITTVATSLTVAAGGGLKFPSANFNITIDDEILLCTTRSGDVLTITRAQEGTLAAAHSAGAAVSLNVTAGIVSQIQAAVDSAIAGLSTHNSKLIGVNAHNNPNVLSGHFDEIFPLPTTAYLKVSSITAIYDPASMIFNTHWYGASGAYTQADSSGCSAANIRKTGASFPASIVYTIVKWASNAAGTANIGAGVITAVADSNNITIVKYTGADFANSYYFWIKHSEVAAPVTGLYMLNAMVCFSPTEANKTYYTAFFKFTGAGAPAFITQNSGCATSTSGIDVCVTRLYQLNTGDKVFVAAYTNSTALASGLYGSYCNLDVVLLQQIA